MSKSSFTAEDSFAVSSAHVGALMGPKGSIIRRLRRETGCHIAVSARGDEVSSKLVTVLTNEQVVTVRGLTAETVASARLIIEQIVAAQYSPALSHSGDDSVSASPQEEHSQSKSSNSVVLFDEWAAFLANIAKRNMRPAFKVHSPGCRCMKATQVHMAVLERVGGQGGALIVVPDSKRPPLAFVCPDTSSDQWADHASECEQALATCIFNEASTTKPAGFKLSCAACMLSCNPNGCVMVVGPTRDVVATVESARVAARLQVAKADAKASAAAADESAAGSGGGKNNKETRSNESTFASALGLHHDHAHFLLALRLDALQHAASARGRDAVQKAERALYEAMVDAWHLQKQHEHGTSNGSGNTTFPGDSKSRKSVSLEHHLQTAGRRGCFESLERANRQMKKDNKAASDTKKAGKQAALGPAADDNSSCDLSVLVMAYADKDVWSLDLPGGKRHLGETSWECARRETWEESSVRVDINGLWLQPLSGVFPQAIIDEKLSVQPPAPPLSASASHSSEDHRGPAAFICAEEVTNDGMRFFLLLPESLAGGRRPANGSKARSEEAGDAPRVSDFEVRTTVSALSRDFSKKVSV